MGGGGRSNVARGLPWSSRGEQKGNRQRSENAARSRRRKKKDRSLLGCGASGKKKGDEAQEIRERGAVLDKGRRDRYQTQLASSMGHASYGRKGVARPIIQGGGKRKRGGGEEGMRRLAVKGCQKRKGASRLALMKKKDAGRRCSRGRAFEAADNKREGGLAWRRSGEKEPFLSLRRPGGREGGGAKETAAL